MGIFKKLFYRDVDDDFKDESDKKPKKNIYDFNNEVDSKEKVNTSNYTYTYKNNTNFVNIENEEDAMRMVSEFLKDEEFFRNISSSEKNSYVSKDNNFNGNEPFTKTIVTKHTYTNSNNKGMPEHAKNVFSYLSAMNEVGFGNTDNIEIYMKFDDHGRFIGVNDNAPESLKKAYMRNINNNR